tara:strand:+ start:1696 stop:2424 length:729 start_codon:yes stop_codon:yes gene_type:complete
MDIKERHKESIAKLEKIIASMMISLSNLHNEFHGSVRDYYEIRDMKKEFWEEPGYHWAILSYLSTLYNDSTIIDVGTQIGRSAVALAYNPSNKIYTYDIKDWTHENMLINNPLVTNVEFILQDCIYDPWDKKEEELFSSSPLIFLDVDPHDGLQEEIFVESLVEIEWKGILVVDDIRLELADADERHRKGVGRMGAGAKGMINWWNSIELPKYDITDNYFGHESGMGIICFGNQVVVGIDES